MGMRNALLIKNAKLISDGTTKPNCGILISHEGRISDVFDMDDYDAQRHEADDFYEAKGQTVTAGLIDTHLHGIGGYGTEDGLSLIHI